MREGGNVTLHERFRRYSLLYEACNLSRHLTMQQ